MTELKTPIYVSSKRMHLPTWQYYRRRGFNIISSWIDVEGALEIETAGREHWPLWIAEAHSALFLIFYAKPGDGAHTGNLLEIGACLAGDGQIIHVGVSDTMKTANGELADFIYHPNWRRVVDLEIAFKIATNRIRADEPLPDDFQ